MTDTSDTPAEPPRQERDIAQELRLRPERPRVTRISRKVLIGLGAAGSIAVFGATIWALQANRRSGQSGELYSTDNKTTADGLANLPRDYTGMPRNVPALGPPLPGDLGRPIVAAQNAGQAVTVPTMPIGTGCRSGGAAAHPGAGGRAAFKAVRRHKRAGAGRCFAAAAIRLWNIWLCTIPRINRRPARVGRRRSAPERPGQEARLRELGHRQAHRQPGSAPGAPHRPTSCRRGTLIAGALLTGIRSDLPGQITGQVTENVYDSPSGRFLLIPQGAKLIGTYDSQVTFGQSRVLLVWTRLIMPNGSSIVLERQPGADAQGYSGLEDEVDNHWGELFKAALLSTLLSVGSEAGTGGQQNDLISAIRQGASNSISQTGSQIVWASAQHSADADHPARISDPRDREPRSRACAL